MKRDVKSGCIVIPVNAVDLSLFCDLSTKCFTHEFCHPYFVHSRRFICRSFTLVYYFWNLDSAEMMEVKQTSAQEVFGHIESVKILVILNPTGYMLTSSGFAFIRVRYIL